MTIGFVRLIALGFGAEIKIVVSIAPIDLQWEKKTKKKFFFETTSPTALIFGLWLMVLYINCEIYAHGVKFGHAPGVDIFHSLTIGKHSNSNIAKASRRILSKSINGL